MSDKLHWSFDDNYNLVKRVFPEGFSAPESTLPAGTFSPDADWENSYDLVYTGPPDAGTDAHVYYGSLRIKAGFKKEQVNLAVTGIVQQNNSFKFERQHFQAECTCRNEMFFPLSENTPWTVNLFLKNRIDPATRPFAQMIEEGRLVPGRIEKKDAGGRWYTYRTVDAGTPVVSDWALLASVHAVPRKKQEISFGYFHELERYTAGHQIHFLETLDASFGGREIKLHGYVQTGRGIPPYYYWVDDSGRLLMARYALSMLVYNANPRLEQEARNDV